MGSVVDEQGRVHGAEALRVVDASIMPSMTSGNRACLCDARVAADSVRTPSQRANDYDGREDIRRHAGAAASARRAAALL